MMVSAERLRALTGISVFVLLGFGAVARGQSVTPLASSTAAPQGSVHPFRWSPAVRIGSGQGVNARPADGTRPPVLTPHSGTNPRRAPHRAPKRLLAPGARRERGRVCE